MIGRDLLIFPDTGDDFLRTLRTATLYAGRVHCMTFVGIPERNRKFGSLYRRVRSNVKNLSHRQIEATRRLEAYGDFLRGNNSELLTARESKVLVPVSTRFLDSSFDASEAMHEEFRSLKVSAAKWNPVASKLMRAAYACPPSFFDFELILPDLPDSDRDLLHQFVFLKYALSLIGMAEREALTLTSWSPAFRRIIWDLHHLLGANRSAINRATEARMGQVILQRRLPRVDDLRVEEILKIRDRGKDEVEAFRSGVADLALAVNTAADHDAVEREIEDLVTTRVDPAVVNLRKKIAELRLDSLKRVYKRSWGVPAVKATFSAVLAHFGTGKIALGVVAAAMAAMMPLAEYPLNKGKLLKNSPWSLLLRIK